MKSISLFKNDTRGQTLFDFVIGVVLLMVVLIFVVMFIPNILQPFFPATGGGNIVDGERVASDITYDTLREDGKPPNVINEDCTAAFFTGTPSEACDVETDDRREILGIGERTDMRITLRYTNGSIATINGSLMEYESSNPGNKETHKSIRVVSIDGTKYELHVVVW